MCDTCHRRVLCADDSNGYYECLDCYLEAQDA